MLADPVSRGGCIQCVGSRVRVLGRGDGEGEGGEREAGGGGWGGSTDVLEDDLKRVEELNNPSPRPRELPEGVPHNKLLACRPTLGRVLARVGTVDVEVDPPRPVALCSAREERVA